MEALIREGALRLLTTEASCDVILSCQGQRLMAHKVMLSIASPVLQDLLRDDTSQPTVLIFPDISGNIMSLVLDYIYTGGVSVYSSILTEFLNIANFLKLHISQEYLTKYERNYTYTTTHRELNYENNKYINTPIQESCNEQDSNCSVSRLVETNNGTNLSVKNNNNVSVNYNNNLVNNHCFDGSALPLTCSVGVKKPLRRVPDLMPISVMKRRKELYNKVFPSPWCPRLAPVLVDPRLECLTTSSNHTADSNTDSHHENDSNNNFKAIKPIYPQPFYPTPFLQNNHRSAFYFNSTLKENLSSPLLYDDAKPTYSTCPPPLPIPNINSHHYPLQSPIPPKIIPPLLEPLNLLPTFEKLPIESKVEEKEKPPLIPIQNTFSSIENLASIKTESCSSSESFPKNSSVEVEIKNEEFKNDDKTDKLKPFKCQDCGKCFSQLRNFKYHRSIHEGTNEFSARCQECGKLFNDRGYLSSHMKIHRDKKEYACPHCPKRFNQRVAYNMHLRIHTGVKPHECPTCGKSFSRKMLLKQHQRVHTGERPYSCPECGKSFADRSNMSLHARLHTGIKPYACNLCPKSFTKKHHLKTHMNFHTGLKPYSCQKCGLSFSQSSNMRTHYKKCILKNTPEKPPTSSQS